MLDKQYYEDFAERELKRWGLWNKGWRFRWGNAKFILGSCKYGNKIIQVNTGPASVMPEEENLDTILHEIAHALAGPANGHNRIWQRWAIKVGANPERLGPPLPKEYRESKHKFQAVCPSCGVRGKKYVRKVSNKYACAKCCRQHNKGKWHPDFVFKIVPL